MIFTPGMPDVPDEEGHRVEHVLFSGAAPAELFAAAGDWLDEHSTLRVLGAAFSEGELHIFTSKT